MQTIPVRIFLSLFVLLMLIPSSVTSATERRTALLIGNSSYKSGPLKNPVNDATDLAANLKRLGFAVILKRNATHQEMEEAIREFGEQLKEGGVGLFYYAGHGAQIGGRNYLLPIGAKINKELDIKFQAVDAEIILGEMGNAGNNLNIVILDACRDNPYARSFRSSSRGLAIISDAPKGTFITYSTSPGKVAADGTGRNSPYTGSLIKHMNTSGLPIEEVFKRVRKDIGRKTSGQQVPWELSSLEGQFYFLPSSVGNLPVNATESTIVRDESPVAITVATDDLDSERNKIELEKQRLEKEESLLAEKAALEQKRQQLEAKKKQLAMGSRPSVSTGNETRRDGRFIAYDNGTVLDTRTNLMWAAKDNGSDINWANAKIYCESYRGGGYTDWRMPTQDELAGLYDKSAGYRPVCAARDDNDKIYLTGLINVSCWAVWASETQGSAAAGFGFGNGGLYWGRQLNDNNLRVLPVRSGK
ncbi:MAG TPA: caspase family protein [Syntrophales bacterium]|nr:caspase family protein [Smithellaceae bacterium]HPN08415.1 caspase family protein [Syntrophales bacterium]HPX80875.1 caspase family protein [Syntrophales bacterium]HQB13176.1 caspase family protein [Syntrophales bacterium]